MSIDDVFEKFIEVDILQYENFLKIKETLSRIRYCFQKR